LLCERFDNKYRQTNAANGSIAAAFDTPSADEADGVGEAGTTDELGWLDEMDEMGGSDGLLFLVHGWEIYRGQLLTPRDFAAGSAAVAPTPSGIISIGDPAAFEGADAFGNIHGNASYRLVLDLPPEPAAYAIALPEIFSACRVWINGVEVAAFGTLAGSASQVRQEKRPPVSSPAYQPQTGEALVSFLAQGRVELLIAASDYSYIYSGLVYPPAFGTPQAVSHLMNTRLLLRAVACTLALLLGAFFLISGILMRKNRLMLLFAALALCFIGYTAYPLVAALSASSMLKYAVESFCFPAMILLVVLLCRQILREETPRGTGDALAFCLRAVLALGVVVCVCSLLRSALAPGNLPVLAAYSLLIELYKWAAALVLTLEVLRAARKPVRYSRSLLIGILVFDAALIMDRLLPLFEPILLGWFLEIAGFVLMLCFFAVIVRETLRLWREKLALESRVAGVTRLIEMERSYYPIILEGIQEARATRHDLRHHLSTLRELAQDGDITRIKQYLASYERAPKSAGGADAAPLQYSDNHIADVIIRHFAKRAAQTGTSIAVASEIGDDLPLDEADLSVILGNLLENAVEACERIVAGEKNAHEGDKHKGGAQQQSERRVTVSLRVISAELLIHIENSYDGLPPAPVRTAAEKDAAAVPAADDARSIAAEPAATAGLGNLSSLHGIGIESVKAAAARYGGTAVFCPEPAAQLYRVVVILPLSPLQ
jgi:hypothetical protein